MKQKLKIIGIMAVFAVAYWIHADYAGCMLSCSTIQSITKLHCLLEPKPEECRKDADKAARRCGEDCKTAWLE
jgi:hypothetical protein